MARLRHTARRLFVFQLIMGLAFITTLMYLVNDNKVMWEYSDTATVNSHVRHPKHPNFSQPKPSTLIEFAPIAYDKIPESPTYDNVDEYPCLRKFRRNPFEVEDLMCQERPYYLPSYKNPCYFSGRMLECLPYYLILGFEKCGTTDFYFRLTSHPDIVISQGDAKKETRYWSWDRYGISPRRDFVKSDLYPRRPKKLFQDYANTFHTASSVIRLHKGSSGQPIVGDATPVDIWQSRGWPLDPQNYGETEPRVLIPHLMRHMFKDPKFFILMRDPVERLFSDYLFVHDGWSAEQFDKDVPRALDIFNSCLRTHSTRSCFYSDDMHTKMPMRLYIGCYSVYLRDWFSVFQRRHFFIIRTEDYDNDIEGTIRAAYSFLGVDSLTDEAVATIVGKERRHSTQLKDRSGVMSNRTRQLLEDFYAPCNNDLAELLQDSKFLWQDTKDKHIAKDGQNNVRNSENLETEHKGLENQYNTEPGIISAVRKRDPVVKVMSFESERSQLGGQEMKLEHEVKHNMQDNALEGGIGLKNTNQNGRNNLLVILKGDLNPHENVENAQMENGFKDQEIHFEQDVKYRPQDGDLESDVGVENTGHNLPGNVMVLLKGNVDVNIDHINSARQENDSGDQGIKVENNDGYSEQIRMLEGDSNDRYVDKNVLDNVMAILKVDSNMDHIRHGFDGNNFEDQEMKIEHSAGYTVPESIIDERDDLNKIKNNAWGNVMAIVRGDMNMEYIKNDRQGNNFRDHEMNIEHSDKYSAKDRILEGNPGEQYAGTQVIGNVIPVVRAHKDYIRNGLDIINLEDHEMNAEHNDKYNVQDRVLDDITGLNNVDGHFPGIALPIVKRDPNNDHSRKGHEGNNLEEMNIEHNARYNVQDRVKESDISQESVDSKMHSNVMPILRVDSNKDDIKNEHKVISFEDQEMRVDYNDRYIVQNRLLDEKIGQNNIDYHVTGIAMAIVKKDVNEDDIIKGHEENNLGDQEMNAEHSSRYNVQNRLLKGDISQENMNTNIFGNVMPLLRADARKDYLRNGQEANSFDHQDVNVENNMRYNVQNNILDGNVDLGYVNNNALKAAFALVRSGEKKGA